MKAGTFSDFTDQLLGMEHGERFVYYMPSGGTLVVDATRFGRLRCRISERGVDSVETCVRWMSSGDISVSHRDEIFSVWEKIKKG